MARFRVIGVEARQIPTQTGCPGQGQRAVDRVVDLGQAIDLFAHDIAVVQGQDDLVVALGPHFLGHQRVGPGRVFPIDRAGVHAGHELGQLVKFGPFAAKGSVLQAIEFRAQGDINLPTGHGADVRRDLEGQILGIAGRDIPEPQAAGPGQPEGRDGIGPAPVGRNGGDTGRAIIGSRHLERDLPSKIVIQFQPRVQHPPMCGRGAVKMRDKPCRFTREGLRRARYRRRD